MGGSSNTQQSMTENSTNQFANYGDGWQVNAGENSDVTVNSLDAEVAITAIEEAGLFAETAADMNARMHDSNLQFADNAMADMQALSAQAQASAAASSAASAAVASRSINGAYQFADNAIADNTSLMHNAISSNNTVLDDSMGMVGNVVQASADQSMKLAQSVFGLAETVKTGTSTSTRNMNKIVTYGAVAAMAYALIKK